MDFAIFVKGIAKEEIKIVAECDGHDFHEKTKDQVARDKSRVRDLEIAGWRILRFTGSGDMGGPVLQLLTLKSESYGTPPDETARLDFVNSAKLQCFEPRGVTHMKKLTVVVTIVAIAVPSFITPRGAHAGDGGAVAAGVAGGLLGGMVLGSVMASRP